MTFEEILARDGRLIYKTRGFSMLPMLHQNQDLVVIHVPDGRLKKYDVALYKRGKAYILHRVIGVYEGGYDIRGDNTFAIEKVPDEAVIGVLTAFVRKGKSYEATDRGYLCYVHFWCAIYPLRAGYRRCRILALKVAQKLGITPVLKKILRR